MKITSSPGTRSKDCLSGDEDPKDALLKARFDRLFEFRKGHMNQKMTKGVEPKFAIFFCGIRVIYYLQVHSINSDAKTKRS